MCDPYYDEDCPLPCDPYYEECPELGEVGMGPKGEHRGEMEEISTAPFVNLLATSAIMVFGSFYLYTEDILDRVDGDNYKGMFYATQLAWVPALVTSTM